MKTYIIKSHYECEIEAESPDEALEKWFDTIGDELSLSNTSIETLFTEKLKAEEIIKNE
jgi:hypothetical protein